MPDLPEGIEVRTIYVCPPKGSEEGLWSDSETGPWRTIAAYRNLDGPEPVEVIAISDLPAIEQAVEERISEGLEAKAQEYEERLARGEWSMVNTREQVKGWGEGVRAALASLNKEGDGDRG